MTGITGYLGALFLRRPSLAGTRGQFLNLRQIEFWKLGVGALRELCHERKGGITNSFHQTVLLSQRFSGLWRDGNVHVLQPTAPCSSPCLSDGVSQNHQDLLSPNQVSSGVSRSVFVGRVLNDKLVQRGGNSDNLINGSLEARKRYAIRGGVFFDRQHLYESKPQTLETRNLSAVGNNHRLLGLPRSCGVSFVGIYSDANSNYQSENATNRLKPCSGGGTPKPGHPALDVKATIIPIHQSSPSLVLREDALPHCPTPSQKGEVQVRTYLPLSCIGSASPQVSKRAPDRADQVNGST